jgi:hypothetical protein
MSSVIGLSQVSICLLIVGFNFNPIRCSIRAQFNGFSLLGSSLYQSSNVVYVSTLTVRTKFGYPTSDVLVASDSVQCTDRTR